MSTYSEAAVNAVLKLHPKTQARNPVMFLVFIGAIFTALLWAYTFITDDVIEGEPTWFIGVVSLWLWATVLFANGAESIAEGKGKAQAASLRSLRREVRAKKLRSISDPSNYEIIHASALRKDDIVVVEAGDFIPCDGQVVDGIASVDESAITGESAPVIRESGGDSDAVTGGTRVLSDWIVVRIGCNPGETFLDKMVSLVEGAKRQKTPNELALSILLAAFSISFLLAIATLLPFSLYAVDRADMGVPIGPTVLIALLVCLAPTTIGGLLSSIGIAGMNRLLKANVIATSGRAIEAAGDVNVLLLDKTGTITHGNRQAEQIFPAEGVDMAQMAEAAMFSSVADQTPEGKSIVALMKSRHGLQAHVLPPGAELIEFSAETRVSGVKLGARSIMKGAGDAIERHVKELGGSMPASTLKHIEEIGRKGGTPLVVSDGPKVLGVIYLKDIVKSGIRERLADLRRMGIKSVMITGDNPITAAAIAAEAGVDNFLAQATPEAKLKLIREMQAGGELVAMVGDGTNDAPALAQSDVALCMNSGTQAAKEASNMVDLDSDPTKLIEIVTIGKQLLITRGALTTFSVANDLAKYFAVVPAAFVSTYPALDVLNVMHLSSPLSAIISAVVFNALILVALIPLSLKGVAYRPIGAMALLRRNLLIYGIGGCIAPFAGIKLIDLLLAAMGVA